MLTDTRAWSSIKTDNGGTLPPMCIYRFNGPGYLYCRGVAMKFDWFIVPKPECDVWTAGKS